MNTVQIFRGKGIVQPWYYRVVSSNGKIVADSGEGYFSRWNAKRAARKLYPEAKIVVLGS